MKRTLATWGLAGALAVSLAWNWKQLPAASPAPAAPEAAVCAEAGCVSGLDALCLQPAQSAALDAVCETACAATDRLAQQADALERTLLERIARSEVDAAEARRLADEVSDLRRQSLAACVEGILRVREVLTPVQRDELVERCGAPAAPP